MKGLVTRAEDNKNGGGNWKWHAILKSVRVVFYTAPLKVGTKEKGIHKVT